MLLLRVHIEKRYPGTVRVRQPPTVRGNDRVEGDSPILLGEEEMSQRDNPVFEVSGEKELTASVFPSGVNRDVP